MTLVLAASGAIAIESLAVGDEVWSYDINTGEWEQCEVLNAFSKQYEGDVYTITIAVEDEETETIECTGNHPFWVVDGESLDARPDANELTMLEQRLTRESHGGHWTEARWLRLGDQFVTKSGKSATVSGLTIRLARVTVYNLHVAGLHTYAVGKLGVGVHNDCDPGTGPDSAPKRFSDDTGRWHDRDGRFTSSPTGDEIRDWASRWGWQRTNRTPGGIETWSDPLNPGNKLKIKPPGISRNLHPDSLRSRVAVWTNGGHTDWFGKRIGRTDKGAHAPILGN